MNQKTDRNITQYLIYDVMTSKKSINFINVSDNQLPMLQGFLASVQNDNGSWDDLTLESSLILEQFLKNNNSGFTEIKKKGTDFILNKIRILAEEYRLNTSSKYSLDSNCMIYGQCLKTLSYVQNEWKHDEDLIISSFKILETLLHTELRSLNNFSAVTSMLYVYTTKLISPDTITRKILSWLITEILSGSYSQEDLALMCTCLARIYSTHNDLAEEIWMDVTKDRIDQWKEYSVEDALNKLLESAYDDTKNRLSENYYLLKAISSWSQDCKNTEIQQNIKSLCYHIDNHKLFERMFVYLKKSGDSLLLSDLANYLSTISENKLDLIGIRSDVKVEVEKAMEQFQNKSQNSQFIKKWKLKGLLTFVGILSGISTILLGVYLPTFGPWLATLPWVVFFFFLAAIYK